MCTDERCRHPYTCDCGKDGCAGPALPDIREELEAEAERRTHERTIQTLRLALLYALVYVLAVAFLTLALGCGATRNGPTGPGETTMELAAEAFASCHGAFFGADIEVVWHQENRSDGACGWAWNLQPDQIHLSRECINALTDLGYLEMIVAHEVCHTRGVSEADLQFCMDTLYREAGCHS